MDEWIIKCCMDDGIKRDSEGQLLPVELQSEISDYVIEGNGEDLLFATLPTELQSDIFDTIVDPKKRQKLREVCKSWNVGLSRLYGVTLLYKKGGCVWKDCLNCPYANHVIFCDYYPQFKTVEEGRFLNGLSELTLTLKENIGSLKGLEILSAESKNVQKLSLDVFEIPKDYDGPTFLGTSMPALKELEIGVTFGYESDWRKNFIKFLSGLLPVFSDKLESISIKCKPILTRDKSFLFGDARVARNEALKSAYFDGTTYTNMFGETWTRPAQEQLKLTDVFIQLVRQNKKSLKKLELDIENSFLGIVDPTNVPQNIKAEFKFYPWTANLAYDSIVEEFQHESVFEEWQSPNNRIGFHPLAFLNTQRHLKKFDFTGFLRRHWEEIGQILASNLNSVEDLCLLDTSQPDRMEPHMYFLSPSPNHFSGLRNLMKFSCSTQQPFRWAGIGCQSDLTMMKLTSISQFPSTIRILKIGTPIHFHRKIDFCSETFENFRNVEQFEFTANPLFYFDDQLDENDKKVYAMDEETVRNLISWMSSLKKLMLRKRVYEIPTKGPRGGKLQYAPNVNPQDYSDTVPEAAIGWIDSANGISVTKIRHIFRTVFKNLPSASVDYLVTILIEPEFRDSVN